ncbi:hypothetical protein BGZ95_001476 [Linnemannia exigua]|uniref:Uncharacterized protein n=1 Tax=Linnemannia exigua TaxID=604196 RepID=A0AAD4HB88_9FUNG|nr:hypothetical protein BGZ95_001476 [Linnemannia exigua]
MDQAATEQTPVAGEVEDNTQAKQQRRRLLTWGIIGGGAILLVITAILILAFIPFNRTQDGVQEVPSKLTVDDSKVRIQLGVVRSGGGVVEGMAEEGGGLVSDVQIESTEVNAVIIHVLEAKVSRERVGVDHNFVTAGGSNDENLVGQMCKEEEEEPALMVDRVSSSTGTFLNFFISSHPTTLVPDNNIKEQGREHDGHGLQRQGRREENTTTSTTIAGRLRLRIEVPFGFTGELTIDGTHLNIEGSSSLADARFNLLHLTTEVGNITLGNSNNNTSISSWKRATNRPTLQVSNLYARVHRHGSVLIEFMGSPEKGKPIRANIETQKGDIFINALQTMITFDAEGEGSYPNPDETVHFFSLVTHQGNIDMQLHEGDSLLGPWYIRGLVWVLAQAKSGSVRGLVEIPDLQLLALDVISDLETALNVSEKFIGELTVRSSPEHQATVNPFPWSKHILRCTHSDMTLKRCKKVRVEDEFIPLGRIDVQASNGPANVTFV